ncbi:MAG: twin-arginine translocase subunit TatB [Nitrospirae bacterium]|nr:twin-arginine translocase subunit TatB [Nitrospirota bacterium]
MFDLGMQELIVIFIVALIVFGPKRLPELGRTIGKGLAELKRAMHGVKEQMDAELHEIKQPVSLDAVTSNESGVESKNQNSEGSDIYKTTQKTDGKTEDEKKAKND